MNNPNFNPNMNLSEHFTLGELCKTSYITADGNIPSQTAIDNLRRLCADWLVKKNPWNQPVPRICFYSFSRLLTFCLRASLASGLPS